MMRFRQGVVAERAAARLEKTATKSRAPRSLVAKGKALPEASRASAKAERIRGQPSTLPAGDLTADLKRYGPAIKRGQIQETIKLSIHTTMTHIVVAMAVYWLWDGKPQAFLIPFCLVVFLTETGVLIARSWFERVEPTRHVVDTACGIAEWVALFQGLTWGSVPIALIRSLDPDHRVIMVAIITGLIGGVFALGSISRIMVLYLSTLVGGAFISLLIEHQPNSLVLAGLLTVYSLFVLLIVLRLNGLSTRRFLDRLKVDDQRETIGLLLNDFEENTSDWLWETDGAGCLTHVSPRMAQAAQVDPSKLLDRAFDEVFDADLIGNVTMGGRQVRTAMAWHVSFRDLIITFERQGARHWWSLSGKPLFGGSGGFVGFRGVGSDITTTMRAQERIAYLANNDFLTGLTNRALFCDLLAQSLQTHDASGVVVLYVDLDDFKIVNDSFGHAVGDEVLRRAANRLRFAVPADAVVARLGGDEFALLLRQASRDDAISLATTLIESLGEPSQWNGMTLAIGASVGIALGAADVPDPETMLHRADLALYEAKSHGKGKFVCFEEALEQTVGARIALQGEIKHAIARNEMMVHYQPILSGKSLQIVGFEALLRWTSPQRGPVSPAEFIPAAEACGSIVAIGAWTLKQACLQASQWPHPIRIAVNLSPLQCRSADLVTIVNDALAVSGLAPNRLELEITESVLLTTTPTIKNNIMELKKIGVRIALDDFGTGFSSLSYLLKFPFDKIKIDRSFVKDLPDRLECVAVVDAIIGIAKRLDVTVTAEGVETREQAQDLVARSCDELQGFLFSPALPARELDGLFERSFIDKDHATARDGDAYQARTFGLAERAAA